MSIKSYYDIGLVKVNLEKLNIYKNIGLWFWLCLFLYKKKGGGRFDVYGIYIYFVNELEMRFLNVV